jgi:hypothetical protein
VVPSGYVPLFLFVQVNFPGPNAASPFKAGFHPSRK